MICDPLEITAREGLNPTAYRVLAQREGHLVAKVETAQGPVVFKADRTPQDMSWDAINIGRLKSADLPVPRVIAQGESPLSYVILSWIEGETLSAESPLAAQLEAGRLLYRVHHLNNRPPYQKENGWDAWMEGWLTVALSWWGEQASVTTKAVDAAWRGFEMLRPLLAERGQHFMLQDGRPDHFIVQGDRIVGLIDVHDAQPGDGGMDLGVFGVEDERLLRNIRLGYGANSAEKEALDQLIPFYIFLRRLAGAEWHTQFGSSAIAERLLAMANANRFGI